jgi:Ca2+-binding EF-hand superfamily protein
MAFAREGFRQPIFRGIDGRPMLLYRLALFALQCQRRVDVTKRLLLALFLASAATTAMSQAPAPRPAGPQPVSRAVFVARVDNAFAALDTNKDGNVDRAEMEAAENKAIAARRAQMVQQRQAAFRQLDKDGNGSLTLQEFAAPVASQPLPKADATARFTRFDTNNDGTIDAAENRAPAVARFNRLDTNKDDILSTEEQRVPSKR